MVHALALIFTVLAAPADTTLPEAVQGRWVRAEAPVIPATDSSDAQTVVVDEITLTDSVVTRLSVVETGGPYEGRGDYSAYETATRVRVDGLALVSTFGGERVVQNVRLQADSLWLVTEGMPAIGPFVRPQAGLWTLADVAGAWKVPEEGYLEITVDGRFRLWRADVKGVRLEEDHAVAFVGTRRRYMLFERAPLHADGDVTWTAYRRVLPVALTEARLVVTTETEGDVTLVRSDVRLGADG